VVVDPTWPLEQSEEDRRLAQTWLLFLQHYQSAFSQLALGDRCAL
jgi:hypothetical protein